jgi:hypothetical protein
MTTQTITVPILNDTIFEGGETFNVTLSGATNATLSDSIGVGTILDDGTGSGGNDDDRPIVSVSNVTVTEGINPFAIFTVSLSNPSTTPTEVSLSLTPGSATGQGVDYGSTGSKNYQVSTDGGKTWIDATSVTFAPGAVSALVRTPIAVDDVAESDEKFQLTVAVMSGITRNANAAGTGVIRDTPPVAPPAPPVREKAHDASPFVFAFDGFHNFSTESSPVSHPPRLGSIDPSRPALLPLAPIYSGEADPGATLVIELYNANGVRIATQMVLADAGGNWLANFGGAELRDAPSDVRVKQVSAPYAFGSAAGHNLRTYYAPAAINPGHFLSQDSGHGLDSGPAPLLAGLDLANPIQLGATKYGGEFLPSEGVASGE